MPPIHPLTDEVINQIAAGEVIERPASVVKELVENSLDAAARCIEVALNQGGIELITVRDDGAGIAREDLALALMRHATSKIACSEDLWRINTFGFRGEALAAIAAACETLVLSSRTRSAPIGYRLNSATGEITPVAMTPGTEVRVVRLFASLPARRKFLRTPATELQHVQELLKRIAAAHPEVEFALQHGDRLLWRTTAGESLWQRLQKLFSLEPNAWRSVAEKVSWIRLEGWVIEPRAAGFTARMQQLFVNKRPGRDRLLAQAIRDAYADVLQEHKAPSFCLFLEIDPERVDINVHPAKSEVRFRDPSAIYHLVRSAVERALAPVALPATCSLPAFRAAPQPPGKAQEQEAEKAFEPGLASEPGPLSFNPASPFGEPVAIVGDLYLVATRPDRLIIIDIHAAHERILYEQLKKNWDQKPIPAQTLLVPVVLKLSSAEAIALAEHRDALEQLGFSIESLSEEKINIKAAPSFIAAAKIETFMRELLGNLSAAPSFAAATEARNALLARLACQAAVRAGSVPGLASMPALLAELAATERGAQCNHGRPTFIEISLEELHRRFERG